MFSFLLVCVDLERTLQSCGMVVLAGFYAAATVSGDFSHVLAQSV